MNEPQLPDLLSQTSDGDTHIAVWTRDENCTWAELANRFRQARRAIHAMRGLRVGFVFQPTADGLACFAALQQVAADVFLMDAATDTVQQRHLLDRFGLHAVYTPSMLMRDRTPDDSTAARPQASHVSAFESVEDIGSVTILTSGTTGEPKAVCHSWEGLTRPVRRDSRTRPVWLLAYRPHLYAGLQVIFQTLLNRGTLVIPAASDEPRRIAELMGDARVELASATPAYWRRLVWWTDPAQWARVPLRQITLGGEAVDQPLLDALRTHFPQARIIHIYATTELGRCFSVTDGRAGFPRDYLAPGALPDVELQIREGQLWVCSRNAMRTYWPTTPTQDSREAPPVANAAKNWFATGDLVEERGDRVVFVGRATDMINVGGNKVYPLIVETTIRQVPGVADVRVYAQPSSLAGQLVACQIVISAEYGWDSVRAAVAAACREKLERYQVPRLIEQVETLTLTAAGKVARSTSDRSSTTTGGDRGSDSL